MVYLLLTKEAFKKGILAASFIFQEFRLVCFGVYFFYRRSFFSPRKPRYKGCKSLWRLQEAAKYDQWTPFSEDTVPNKMKTENTSEAAHILTWPFACQVATERAFKGDLSACGRDQIQRKGSTNLPFSRYWLIQMHKNFSLHWSLIRFSGGPLVAELCWAFLTASFSSGLTASGAGSGSFLIWST